MTAQGPAPHRNLHTRLQVSPGRGIGVFAIRDIPQRTRLFAGDSGETVRFPLAAFERIEDAAVRQVYLDFCPLVDGAFVAPVDLNQLTMAWYMNHSREPNVAADALLHFTTSRLVRKGEELTTDYTRFSEHADRFVGAWS